MTTILHVTEDHSIHNTGITSAVDALVRQLARKLPLDILAAGPEAVEIPPGVGLRLLNSEGISRLWRYVPGQRGLLREAVKQAGVVHLHGLWMWPQWAAAQEAYRLGKPFVVTTHGMLEPWIAERPSWPNRLKKSVYWRAWAYPAFRHAALIHTLTPVEAGHVGEYFPGQTLVTIPQGIDLPAIAQQLAEIPPGDPGEPPYFLFLGRLNPVKGLHLLIRAFAQLPQTEFKLKLAGPAQARDAQYAIDLQHLVQELGLGERVQFLGRVTGAPKWKLYRDAWAFCLPSFSEGMPMVSLEAAACATPVLTTSSSGVISQWGERGGMLLQPAVESLLEGLRQAAGWTREERDQRGASLRGLVQEQYSWEVVLPQWLDVYTRLIEGNNP